MASRQNGFLTVNEAAELLRVSISTIRRWIRDGSLPAHRAGRRRILLRRADLTRMLHTVVAERDASASEPSRSSHAAGQATGKPAPPGDPEEFDLGPLKGLIEHSPDRPRQQPITVAEQQRRLAAIEQATRIQERISQETGVKQFPPSWPIIEEMREERTRQLMEPHEPTEEAEQ